MTGILIDDTILTGLEQRARRNRRPLNEEIHAALFAAAASFAEKRGLSPREFHDLAKGVAGVTVEVW